MDDSFFSEALLEEFDIADSDYSYSRDLQSIEGLMEVDSNPLTTVDDSSDSDADSEAIDGTGDGHGIRSDSDRVEDEVEDREIDKFITNTCGCQQGPGSTACSRLISREEIARSRMNCKEMTKDEMDLIILANLEANRKESDGEESVRSRIAYSFHGRKICKSTFLFLHSIGAKRFKNLVAHYDSHGLMPRRHGNKKRLPANTTPFSVTQDVVQFITNFATLHALPLPGRIPGLYSHEKALLLPSDMSKRYVFRQFCEANGESLVSRRQFETLWSQLVPHISTMKPATDLCETCHSNIVRIVRSSNLPETEKSQQLQEAEHHLRLAKQERDIYNEECIMAKEELQRNPPKFMHLSFDFAQQLHFPSSPQQVGPLFFLTPRKCQLFGICNEALSEQVNYLIDENDIPGKGANCVLSMLHHYLENKCSGQDLLLHADNAVGQNKNNTVMQYLCWRVLTGRNAKVKISFMLAGHTKFAPDRFFGLIKRSYRRTNVSSLPEIEKMICNSSVSGKNIPQPTLDCMGKRNVIWYNWSGFLNPFFNSISGIAQYHHFYFDSSAHGVVTVKEHSKTSEKVIEITNLREFDTTKMPEVIKPPGISFDRQKYLFEKIRPFCSSELASELTCPQPQMMSVATAVEGHVQPSKSKRKCSHCRQIGHTKTVCGVITCPQLLNKDA